MQVPFFRAHNDKCAFTRAHSGIRASTCNMHDCSGSGSPRRHRRRPVLRHPGPGLGRASPKGDPFWNTPTCRFARARARMISAPRCHLLAPTRCVCFTRLWIFHGCLVICASIIHGTEYIACSIYTSMKCFMLALLVESMMMEWRDIHIYIYIPTCIYIYIYIYTHYIYIYIHNIYIYIYTYVHTLYCNVLMHTRVCDT